MKNIAIFGAGAQGRTAAAIYKSEGRRIDVFIDNSPQKIGTKICDIPVVGLDEYVVAKYDCEIIIACSPSFQNEIIEQLSKCGVYEYTIFPKEKILQKERIISYSYPTENEDIILYHVLKDIPSQDIRWIDVGSNDPHIGSVTQLFYERGGCGINIDMEQDMVRISEAVRIRDVNLWCAIGNHTGTLEYFSQGDYGGLSTALKDNADDKTSQKRLVEVTTLNAVCEKYVEFPITFLKIDVEGMERDVLMGMDFRQFRPWIVIMESTIPKTFIPNYEQWEDILENAGYHFVYTHGVNRYYVADEQRELDAKFIPWEEIVAGYCVLHADLLYAV